ncbi:hypothetical protein BJ138DRAFT_1093573 [Hygrophoropsis aurantiaca]|uniref:Uncharacterized protein n=1 Tax=Hygrophoropsis aurantiaca TaxID=72124 RepID=A0ACB8A1I7_9AGAM|nr:hypothetical protein BJ138DRAFT_1093573 [Hygrophoropsis aurantiaca]
MSFDTQSGGESNTALNTTRPAHHIHKSSEPLPGSNSRAAAQTQDYSPDTIERTPSSALHDTTASSGPQRGQLHTQTSFGDEDTDSTHATLGSPAPSGPSTTRTGAGINAPLQGTQQARDELPGVPTGQPKMGDKVIGKAQQLVGKATKNPVMQEKGEIRGTNGKGAVQEAARLA